MTFLFHVDVNIDLHWTYQIFLKHSREEFRIIMSNLCSIVKDIYIDLFYLRGFELVIFAINKVMWSRPSHTANKNDTSLISLLFFIDTQKVIFIWTFSWGLLFIFCIYIIFLSSSFSYYSNLNNVSKCAVRFCQYTKVCIQKYRYMGAPVSLDKSNFTHNWSTGNLMNLCSVCRKF